MGLEAHDWQRFFFQLTSCNSWITMCQGLNSHYFHILWDGHQPNSRVYIPIIRIPIKGVMTIPNIATFDHGTYDDYKFIYGLFH